MQFLRVYGNQGGGYLNHLLRRNCNHKIFDLQPGGLRTMIHDE